MGSFNVTCFASLQSIATGDRCFVLPVLQESSYDAQTVVRRGVEERHYGVAMTHSYAHAFWTPYGGFIEARYGDRGNVDLLDTPINRLRLRELFRRLLSSAPTKELDDAGVPLFDFKAFVEGCAPALLAELGRAAEQAVEYVVPSSDAALFADMQSAWSYLETAMWHHRVFADDIFHRLRPLQWAVMHKSAFEELVSLVENNLLLSNGSARREDVLQRFLADAPGFLDPQALPAAPDSPEERELRLEALVTRSMQESSLRDALAPLDRCGSLHYPSERVELVLAFNRYRSGELSRGELDEVLRPTFDTRYALGGLNELNLRIAPAAFGGEDYSNEVGRQYARLVQTVSAQVCEQRAARYD